jgi:hypothetical protein
MLTILNSADKSYKFAVAVGDEVFNAEHRAVNDLLVFPVGSQYTNQVLGMLFVRMAAEKKVSDWVAIGGSGMYAEVSAAELSAPTAEKWGASAILTGLKEANVQIPVPSATWTKVNIRQVNDALAKAFPDGIEGEIEGNVRDVDYNYADVTGDIANDKLSYDVLALVDHNISIVATFYNGTTEVSVEKAAIVVSE